MSTRSLESTALDLRAIRRDFPILAQTISGKPLVYLDNAATSQKPLSVIEAMDLHWRETNANVHRGVHSLSQQATDLFEDARTSVRRFVNARADEEIIFTKGCTEGINLVSTGLERISRGMGVSPMSSTGILPVVREGDVILLTTMEHHSNIVPWQILAEQTGAKVIPIPITDEGELDLDAYEKLLQNNSVKVVALVHVSNAIGTINPVKEMVRQAHDVGALALIDGAQAGPHMRVDVQDVDADFYTLSCHKHYAPTGIGVLYGKRALLEALPAYQGGGSMIRSVSFEKTTYADIPAKFEPGTPNIGGVIGLGAAVNYLETLGSGPDPLTTAFAAIQEHERQLVQAAESALNEIPGIRLIGTAKHKAAIVSFVIDGVHPHDVGTVLDNDGIAVRAGHHCCMPLMNRFGVAATTRASFSLYNTLEEVEILAQSVRRVRELFA